MDKTTLFSYVDLDKELDLERKDITVQKVSALARVMLLSKYGGVWVDATVFCHIPLEDWICKYEKDGFCVFTNPGPERLASNWFFYARKDHPIIIEVARLLLLYYKRNRFSRQNSDLGKKILNRLVPKFQTPERSIFWHKWWVKKMLKVYPYFIFHYTFNRVVLRNRSCQKIWNQLDLPDAAGPHKLQHLRGETREVAIQTAKEVIDARQTPVFKLNWRWGEELPYWDVILPYLYKSIK